MKDVIVLMEQTSSEEVKDLASELPSDLHLVEYVQAGELHVDGVRAYSRVDIFDFYYDYLSDAGEPFEIKSIKNGYGRIKPRLFNAQQEE